MKAVNLTIPFRIGKFLFTYAAQIGASKDGKTSVN